MTAVSEEEPIKFVDFDAAFQEKLVALQVRDQVFARRTDGLLLPTYFESQADATLFNLASNYYEKYRRAPSDPAIFITLLKSEIAKGRIKESLKEDCVDKVKSIFKTDISDRDFAIDQVGEFARHQAIQAAMLQAFDFIEKHDTKRAEEIMLKAFTVGPHADSSEYDYWGEIGSRTSVRLDMKAGKVKPAGLSTGIREFDAVLKHRGWGIKELTVFMAGAKKGKSFTIWDFGKLQSLQGRNVLGITLEVSKEVLSDRLDASVADVLIDDVDSSIRAVEAAVESVAKSAGKFIIHEFPTGSFRPKDLEDLIESYKAKGTIFECIVIDYLDIMAPNRWTPDEAANNKSIWVDTRAVAQREELAIISATQTNREGHKSITAKAEHAAEDFNKIRIADLVISLNATEEEMAKGEARFFFAASRNQRGEFSLRVERDLSKGHALKRVVGFA